MEEIDRSMKREGGEKRKSGRKGEREKKAECSYRMRWKINKQ